MSRKTKYPKTYEEAKELFKVKIGEDYDTSPVRKIIGIYKIGKDKFFIGTQPEFLNL